MRLVYIDENGNEIPVSGRPTSAENLPIAPGSTKSTAEAIGDLGITDITNDISFHSGVVRILGSVYKQGKLVVCNLSLKIEQNISNGETFISGLPIMPARSVKFPCLVGTDQYLIGESDGALYMQVNTTSIIRWGNLTATAANPKYMTMMFVYATT